MSCFFIKAEHLLMNYFAIHHDKDEINARTLENIKEILQNNLDVYVQITRNDIRWVCDYRYFNFELIDNNLVKLVNPESFRKNYTQEKVESLFNWEIPENIRKDFVQLITEYSET